MSASIGRVVRGVAWRAGARSRVLPDFLIIGAQKAGTTSLYDELCGHRQIVQARKKEVRFFDRHWSRGPLWYRWNFPTRRVRGEGSERRITGEATPDYLLHPLAPARAASLVPHCRLIVLLRHPVERAHSQYRMNVLLGEESRSFEEAVDDELRRLEMRMHDAVWDDERNFHSYVERSRYYPQLARWLEHFPRSSLHVTSLEAIVRSPRQELVAIHTFIGVETAGRDVAFAHANRRVYDPLVTAERSRLFSLFADDLANTERLLDLQLGYQP